MPQEENLKTIRELSCVCNNNSQSDSLSLNLVPEVLFIPHKVGSRLMKLMSPPVTVIVITKVKIKFKFIIKVKIKVILKCSKINYSRRKR